MREQFTATSEGQNASAAISVYPPGTRRDLVHLIAAAAAFAVGAALFYESKPLLQLMTALAAAGTAVACCGLIQRASSLEWRYAGFDFPMNAWPFGPFVARNNAGGFLNIAFAAAIGVLVWRIQKFSPRLGRHDYDPFFSWFLQNLNPALFAAGVAVVCILSGIVLSFSRGAMLAAAMGGIATLVIIGVVSQRQFLFWLIGLGMVVSLAIVVWIGQGDAVGVRIFDSNLSEESRPLLWLESMDAAKVYGWFGSGLGTFYYGHAPFENHVNLGLYRNGENQYVESLVVGGYLGFFLLLLLGGVCLRAAARLVRGADEPERVAVAAGGVALLFTQGVCACFDFGWYIPALYIPLCVWAGGLVRRVSSLRHRRTKRRRVADAPDSVDGPIVAAKSSVPTPAPVPALVPDEASKPREASPTISWALFGGIAALLAAGIGWSLVENGVTRIVEKSEHATRRLFQSKEEHSAGDVDVAADLQRAALDVAPDDGEVRVRFAEVLVEQFRLKSGKQVLDLHAAAQLFERIGNDAGLAALRNDPLVVQYLKPALHEARQARELCPFSFFAQRLTAQLCFLDEKPSANAVYLACAERLAQGHALWLLEIGAMHLDAARLTDAWRVWRQAWTLSPLLGEQIATQGLAYLTPQELLDNVIPNDPQIIYQVIRRKLPDREFSDIRQAYCRKIIQLLLKYRKRTAEREYLHGYALAELGKWEDADETLSAALREVNAEEQWYFDLAVVRAALGRFELAEVAFERYRLLVGGSESARDYLLRAADQIRSQPNPDALLRYRCGLVLLRANEPSQALAEFRRAAELNSAMADAYAGMAEAMLKIGKVDEAVQAAIRAVDLAPTRNDLRELRGRAQAAEKMSQPKRPQ
ncbi:MAG: hypothetical protein C0483_17560 [Pirellula sp.]|nr:hypothetical protein [Pirellula sp.]